MMVWKMFLLFQGCILRFHVNLARCTWFIEQCRNFCRRLYCAAKSPFGEQWVLASWQDDVLAASFHCGCDVAFDLGVTWGHEIEVYVNAGYLWELSSLAEKMSWQPFCSPHCYWRTSVVRVPGRVLVTSISAGSLPTPEKNDLQGAKRIGWPITELMNSASFAKKPEWVSIFTSKCTVYIHSG